MYAIDRAGIVKEILWAKDRSSTRRSSGRTGWASPEGLNEYAYDPNKAKQLLKDANWNSSTKLNLIYITG